MKTCIIYGEEDGWMVCRAYTGVSRLRESGHNIRGIEDEFIRNIQ